MAPRRPPRPRSEASCLAPAVLNLADAAHYLGVGVGLLYRLMRSGRVPHARVGACAIRFRVADLDAYLVEGTTRTWTPSHRGQARTRRLKVLDGR